MRNFFFSYGLQILAAFYFLSCVQNSTMESEELEEDSTNFYEMNIENGVLHVTNKISDSIQQPLVFFHSQNDTVFHPWAELNDVTHVRDRSGWLNELTEGRSYAIIDGYLNVLFEGEYLTYAISTLTALDKDMTFELDSVKISFTNKTYHCGENFVQFVEVDTISSETMDLSIFINTDIEVDFECLADTFYVGKLIYIQEPSHYKLSNWKRKNFKFELY